MKSANQELCIVSIMASIAIFALVVLAFNTNVIKIDVPEKEVYLIGQAIQGMKTKEIQNENPIKDMDNYFNEFPCWAVDKIDYNCPLETPICVNQQCVECINYEDTSSDEYTNWVSYYSSSSGSIATLNDMCGKGEEVAPIYTDFSCDISPDSTHYIKDFCPRSQHCALGECRQRCQGDDGCFSDEVCIQGYCLDDFYDFFEWMQDKGYDQDLIDTYREGGDNQLNWLYSWWNNYLIERTDPNPHKLLEEFRNAENMYVTVNFIQDINAQLNRDVWNEDDVQLFQDNLNLIYGRDPNSPFFIVDMDIIEEDYDNIYSCDGCSIELNYLDEPVEIQMEEGIVTYDTIIDYTGNGAHYYANGEEYYEGQNGLNEYKHHECSTDGADIYFFNTYLNEEGYAVSTGFSCLGMTECNVVCSWVTGVSSDHATIFHEIGHTFGFYHPYDLDNYVMGPDSIMCQTDVISGIGMPHLFSPIEYYLLEPEGGFYNDLTDQVADYNANSVVREYMLINEVDY